IRISSNRGRVFLWPPHRALRSVACTRGRRICGVEPDRFQTLYSSLESLSVDLPVDKQTPRLIENALRERHATFIVIHITFISLTDQAVDSLFHDVAIPVEDHGNRGADCGDEN